MHILIFYIYTTNPIECSASVHWVMSTGCVCWELAESLSSTCWVPTGCLPSAHTQWAFDGHSAGTQQTHSVDTCGALSALAYISKGCTPIQVFPVQHAYTTFKQTTSVFALNKKLRNGNFRRFLQCLFTECGVRMLRGSTVKHEIFATWKFREFAILANFGT